MIESMVIRGDCLIAIIVSSSVRIRKEIEKFLFPFLSVELKCAVTDCLEELQGHLEHCE